MEKAEEEEEEEEGLSLLLYYEMCAQVKLIDQLIEWNGHSLHPQETKGNFQRYPHACASYQ